MTGKRKENEAGSSNDLRADVLRVLGVLKVATADQIQRRSSPPLTYRHTTKPTPARQKEAGTASHRAAANDLRRHGLAVDGGRTWGGEETRLLTKDGLAAAAIDLDRDPEETGGMPKSAGRSGASHPMTVNETVIALIRPKPNLELVCTPDSSCGRRRTPTPLTSRCGAPAAPSLPPTTTSGCTRRSCSSSTRPASAPPRTDGQGRRPHPPLLAGAVAFRGRLPLLRPLHPDRGDDAGWAARTRPGRARLLALRPRPPPAAAGRDRQRPPGRLRG